MDNITSTPIFSLPAQQVQTRWATAENPDAVPGQGGMTNHGRKGNACKAPFAAGEEFVMAHAKDTPGMVRRIWVTISDRSAEMVRGVVIRMYWDGQTKPAVEAPLGDLFCQPLGQLHAFENAWFDNPEGRSLNMRIPMPFRKEFRITATNETSKDMNMFFYEVDFTVGDELPADMGYFHAYYNRNRKTAVRNDFVILPRIEGKGRFLGCCLGVIANTAVNAKTWWGEGEVKMYIDGDTDYPTLCGTGTEDYISTAWGQGHYAHLWHGCSIADGENYRYGFYRLHGPDPVWFHKDIRVTIQQIGWSGLGQMFEHLKTSGITEMLSTGDGTRKLTIDGLVKGNMSLFERHDDDWCATAYFYLDSPSSTLPPIQPLDERTAGLEKTVNP